MLYIMYVTDHKNVTFIFESVSHKETETGKLI